MATRTRCPIPRLPLMTTPSHPEYPAGHPSLNGAAATVLLRHFKERQAFTLTTAGQPSRTYASISQARTDGNNARVWADAIAEHGRHQRCHGRGHRGVRGSERHATARSEMNAGRARLSGRCPQPGLQHPLRGRARARTPRTSTASRPCPRGNGRAGCATATVSASAVGAGTNAQGQTVDTVSIYDKQVGARRYAGGGGRLDGACFVTTRASSSVPRGDR